MHVIDSFWRQRLYHIIWVLVIISGLTISFVVRHSQPFVGSVVKRQWFDKRARLMLQGWYELCAVLLWIVRVSSFGHRLIEFHFSTHNTEWLLSLRHRQRCFMFVSIFPSRFFKSRLLFPGCVMIEQEWLTKKVQTIEIIILSLVFLSVRDRVKRKLFLCGFQVDAWWDEAREGRHRLKPESSAISVCTNGGTFEHEPFFRRAKFSRVLPLFVVT